MSNSSETDTDYSLADVLGAGQTYRLPGLDISPLPGFTEASDFFFGNRGDFELQEIDSTIDSNNETFSVDEDIFASYLLGRWESDKLLVIGGVRYERTYNRLTGNIVRLIETDDDEFVHHHPARDSSVIMITGCLRPLLGKTIRLCLRRPVL